MTKSVVLFAPGAAQLAERGKRRKAFEKILRSLPKRAHPRLARRTIIDTQHLVHGTVLNIHQFCHLLEQVKPVSTQRDHVRRDAKGETKYLNRLHPTHLCFTLAMHPHTLELGQVDGNTRREVWFKPGSKMTLPSHIALTTHFPDNESQLEDIYWCTDASVAAKRMAHSLQSAYRHAGGDPNALVSELFQGGYWTSAAYRLAAVHSIGPIRGAGNQANLCRLVALYAEVIPWVDRFGLGAKQLVQGYVGAVMWLAQQALERGERLTRAHPLATFMKELIAAHKPGYLGKSRALEALLDDVARMTVAGKGHDTAIDAVFASAYLGYHEYLAELVQAPGLAKSQARQLLAQRDALEALPTRFENQRQARLRLAA